jgi:hypothetical protein
MDSERRPPALDEPQERERVIRLAMRGARLLQVVLLAVLWILMLLGSIFALGRMAP